MKKEVVDVRTIPRSRHNPQFNEETLRDSLKQHRLRYRLLKKLGGLRHAQKESINRGWRNVSFRGFADYMATADFSEGLDALIKIARARGGLIPVVDFQVVGGWFSFSFFNQVFQA